MVGTRNGAIELLLSKLVSATNTHDLDALVSCFSRDYVNETPAHPMRSFTGAEQVRKNWERLFEAIPDLEAEILHALIDGATAWTEWELRGTRRDGTDHLMRGVMIFTVDDGALAAVRFYLEPVERAGGDIDVAITQAAGSAPASIRKDVS